MSRRTILNAAVDLLAFASFTLMISTGFVLQFLLPPGSGRLVGEGTGVRAAEKSVTLLMGLTRHDWGRIHFVVSLALMAILAIHLVLHWRWIFCVITNKSREGSALRAGLGLIGFITILAFASAPLFVKTESAPRSVLQETDSAPHHNGDGRGSLTLQEVEERTGVPVDTIKQELHLPDDVPPHARIGKLKRLYGFSMEDLDRVIDEYENAFHMPVE